MHKYKLETIKGTEKFVERELSAKFSDSTVVSKKSGEIIFESEKEIDDFRELLSVLRISNEQGLTRNLFRREWRKEFVPAGINPALAFIMCMIADIMGNETILDPFCGGGTIPITASLYFSPKKAIASDISGKAVNITKKNFEEAKIPKEKYFVLQKGVRDLVLKENSIDKVITNLPFGIRTGTHNMNEITYLNFEKKIRKLVKPQGLLIILTQEKELLRDTFKKDYYKITDEIVVNQGGLKPSIFIIKKS